jgi:hypothetical protein
MSGQELISSSATWAEMEGKHTTESPTLAAEIRLLREQISGLNDTVAQFVQKSGSICPPFVFAELENAAGEEVRQTAELLLSESSPDYKLHLSRDARHSESFFLDYYSGQSIDSLTILKLAIQCEQNHSAFQHLLFKLYRQNFRNRYKQAVESFAQHYGDADLIVLHLSCKPRAKRAAESAATFEAVERGVKNLIVVGHVAGKLGSFSLNPDSDLLVVPTDDAYEGLAEKAAAAYAFLSFAGNRACVLKVDDDVQCLSMDRILSDLCPLVRARDYLGRVWHSRLGFSRSWHLGKCADPDISNKPYSLLTNASYAEGPAYFLSSRAVHVLAKAAVYLEQVFETERSYEDLAMGKVLNHYGITPVNYDPIQNRIVLSTDKWMMDRAGFPSGK